MCHGKHGHTCMAWACSGLVDIKAEESMRWKRLILTVCTEGNHARCELCNAVRRGRRVARGRERETRAPPLPTLSDGALVLPPARCCCQLANKGDFLPLVCRREEDNTTQKHFHCRAWNNTHTSMCLRSIVSFWITIFWVETKIRHHINAPTDFSKRLLGTLVVWIIFFFSFGGRW